MPYVHVDTVAANRSSSTSLISAAATVHADRRTCSSRAGQMVVGTGQWVLKRGASVLRRQNMSVTFCTSTTYTTYFNTTRREARSPLTVCFSIIGSSHGVSNRKCSPVQIY